MTMAVEDPVASPAPTSTVPLRLAIDMESLARDGSA
jgi:hypothetical protein